MRGSGTRFKSSNTEYWLLLNINLLQSQNFSLQRPNMGTKVPILGLYGLIEELVMVATSIGDALFTKTQQKVLGLLFAKPDKSYYTNEIMRWASMGRGTVSRELDRLVSAGLLTVLRQGNQNYYQANFESPIYNELVSIIRKTFGVADEIKAKLKSLNENIELAFIYGSIAKGDDTKTSDIDLMLVGEDLSYGEVMESLMPLEKSLLRTINPTIYETQDFFSKLNNGNSFVARVMEQPKIIIMGDENAIRETR